MLAKERVKEMQLGQLPRCVPSAVSPAGKGPLVLQGAPPCQCPIKARPCPQLCLGFLAEFLNEMMLHGEMILKEERETRLRFSEEQVVAACLLQLKAGMRNDGGTCAGLCPGDLLPGAFPSAMCPAAFLL